MSSVVLFLADGFEEIEAITVVDVLRRATIKCDICGLNSITVKGAHGIEVKCDKIFEKINDSEYDALVLPGGMPGAKNLKENGKLLKLVNSFYKQGKIVAAICAAPMVLDAAGIIKGKTITSYPGLVLSECDYVEKIVVEDKNIITSRGPATAMVFSYKLLEKLGYEHKVEGISSGMLYTIKS